MKKESFDEKAATWDDEPRRVQMAQTLFSAIEQAVSLRGDAVALDYGCGTGLLSLPLATRVSRVIAVDLSEGMLKVLNRKARDGGIDTIETLQADFSTDPIPADAVDLIASAMALHHVADTQTLLQSFFDLLASGGTVALADLDSEDGSFHGSMEGIPHTGFDRDSLGTQLAACGFDSIQFTTATHIEKNDRDYPVFLVTARKP
jgi:ubiquinone/menaquinone biosynthesis C-methylase UbiE